MTPSSKIPAHPWDLAIPEAIRLQKKLAGLVIEAGEPDRVRVVAGCDLAFDLKRRLAVGALVLLSFPGLDLLETITRVQPVSFPYVPGLLSFREGPVIMELFRAARHPPDLILFDGQGRAHPRGLGVASHLGLLLGIPAIGVAKSRLYGAARDILPPEKGAMTDLLAPDGRVIGRVLRTRTGVQPLYVSVGHRIGLDAACRLTLACVKRTRLPEPSRLAHQAAGKAKLELG